MRRRCDPSEHLVTVVGRRRMRDALGKRYWIRCQLCDLSHGPYDEWEAAWQELLRAQVAARRPAGAGYRAGGATGTGGAGTGAS
jgi:hypothetical protein